MKRIAVALLLILAIMLTGCTVLKLERQDSDIKTLQALGLAYTEGTYTMKGAYVSGFITTSGTVIRLGIPVGKKLIEGQEITVMAANGAYLRTEAGKFVLGEKGDLTPYIGDASIRNDGTILLVRFTNTEKWTGSDGKTIKNNTPIVGTIDIEFSISDTVIQEAEAKNG